jgi:hypothetical protein
VKLLRECLLVLILAALVAVALWSAQRKALAGRMIYGVPTVSRSTADRLERSGKRVVWVEIVPDADVLSAKGVVLHLATWESDLNRLLEVWTPDDILVVTGSPKSREATRKGAERLALAGLPEVRLLAWEDEHR